MRPRRVGGEPEREMAHHTPSIFISYRRADAAANVGRLFDWLTRYYGEDRVHFEQVFVDTDGIDPGQDFEQVLNRRLAAADVVLVVIGPHWLDARNERGRRLDQPEDYVRREVAAALAQGKRVIPVLVGGASMPSRDALPEPLKPLATLNAIAIDDALHSFRQDFDRLVDAILQRRRGRLEVERDRLRLFLRALRLSSLLVPATALLLVLALWVGLLEGLGIDRHVSGWIQGLGDRLFPHRPGPGVTLVALDAATLARLTPRPGDQAALAAWFRDLARWRRDAAALVDRLSAAGARAVVFDLYFEQQSAADAELAAAIGRARERGTRVVLGARRLDPEGRPLMAPLLREAADWGSVCIHHLGGSSVMVALAALDPAQRDREIQRGRLPALALRAVSADPAPRFAIAAREIVLEDGGERPVPRFSLVRRIRYLTPQGDSDACRIPPDGADAAMLLLHRLPPGYWQDPVRRLGQRQVLKGGGERLRGQVVMIGALDGARDRARLAAGRPYGLELHASAVADLLQGHALKRPTLGSDLLLMLLLGAAGAALGYLAAAWPTMRRRLTLAGALLGYLALAVILVPLGWLLPVLYHLGAFLAAYFAICWLWHRTLAGGPGLPER